MSAKMPARISSLLSSFLPRTWRLNLAQRRINRLFRKEVADAKTKGSSKDLRRIDFDREFEVNQIEEELQGIFDSHLIRQARRLHIDTPKAVEGNWEKGRTGEMLLTPAARKNLRAAVREERKERRDAAMFWISAMWGIHFTQVTTISVFDSLGPWFTCRLLSAFRI